MNIRAFLLMCLSATLISCINHSVETQEKDTLSGELIIFHAGSLSIPIKALADSFNIIHPGLKIKPESAGSLTSIRKITDLRRDCDILASADASMIDKLMIPDHAKWNLEFATNELVIVYHKHSKKVDQISIKGWADVLADPEVRFGRSDPNSDPCGYRTVLAIKLEDLSKKKGNVTHLLEKDNKYIRPKEVDLLALIETNTIDYAFLYKSIALQHNLPYIQLSDSINLGNVNLNNWYNSVDVEVSGTTPYTKVKHNGEAIIYGITIPTNSKNPKAAREFILFLISKGKSIIEKTHQTPISETRFSQKSIRPQWLN